ncbi:MAG TPA: chemotaxis protein CheW [Rhodanobacteraceae bacterium]|nr:chemotaxis protein CheW [Oleiagrimonas sp.]HET9819501.1 chemotaxis protein CheW [Rhodanobacteraceae bacterium]
MSPDTVPSTSTWLGFELAGQHYAVPLADVREIMHPEPPAPVPGAPTDVLGIINLRGSIVTVLDGCIRLGLAANGDGPDQRLVIFQDELETVGMRIDALHDVLELDTRELMPSPPGRVARADDPVLGALYREGTFIALLDTRKLCRPRTTTMEASA